MAIDRRAKYREGLHSLYLPRYDILCEVLPQEWQPYSGFRTIAEQDELFKVGRSIVGERVTNAIGGESPHNYGMATDWVVWDPVLHIPMWKVHDWHIYTNAIKKAGTRWGGDFRKLRRDDPHNELALDCPWSDVFKVYSMNGMDAAIDLITKKQINV